MFELEDPVGNNRDHLLRRDELKGCRGCTKQHRGNRRQILPADFHPRAFGAAGGSEPEYFRRTNLGCGRECGKQEEAAARQTSRGRSGECALVEAIALQHFRLTLRESLRGML